MQNDFQEKKNVSRETSYFFPEADEGSFMAQEW
jgi:hypothetical protein